MDNEWSCCLFRSLESQRGKTGQFPMVCWSPERPQHTPNTKSEESNPSLDRRRRWGGWNERWAKP